MKKTVVVTFGAVVFLLGGQAEAAGCVKGAVVGAVAGHVAGHHAVVGAIAGCAIGHHLAKEKAKKVASQQLN